MNRIKQAEDAFLKAKSYAQEVADAVNAKYGSQFIVSCEETEKLFRCLYARGEDMALADEFLLNRMPRFDFFDERLLNVGARQGFLFRWGMVPVRFNDYSVGSSISKWVSRTIDLDPTNIVWDIWTEYRSVNTNRAHLPGEEKFAVAAFASETGVLPCSLITEYLLNKPFDPYLANDVCRSGEYKSAAKAQTFANKVCSKILDGFVHHQYLDRGEAGHFGVYCKRILEQRGMFWSLRNFLITNNVPYTQEKNGYCQLEHYFRLENPIPGTNVKYLSPGALTYQGNVVRLLEYTSDTGGIRVDMSVLEKLFKGDNE